jgi:hypothetical protein
MKKIFAILALAVSGSVFAASASIEYQNIDVVGGTTDQKNVNLTVREAINQNFTGDVSLSNAWNNNTGGFASFRAEAGVTGAMPVAGPIGVYTRVATGQKFTSTTNFGYYSVEPGVTAALGGGFNAKVGYRFREAFATGDNDTTRTWRAGVTYDLTKKDTIGVRYDQMRGDAKQNIWAVNYTRGF